MKTYDLITAVFQVRCFREGAITLEETSLCVAQRVKLYDNLTRGAAIKAVTANVAKRYRTSESNVKFWFWADSWSVPGEDVDVKLENKLTVTAR